METPVEGSFALLDAADKAFGFTVSAARTPLGCVLLLPKRAIAAQTPLDQSICAGFRRVPARREPIVLWRSFAHDTA